MTRGGFLGVVGSLIASWSQASIADDDSAGAVEKWVRADIDASLQFIRAPENLRFDLQYVVGMPGTPEQVAQRDLRIAALRRAVEGKPDHPMRDELLQLEQDAPGAENSVGSLVWVGTLRGVPVYRIVETHARERQTNFEPLHDSGCNGNVRWEVMGGQGKVYIQTEIRSASPIDGYFERLNHVFTIMTGWFGESAPAFQPSSVHVEPLPPTNAHWQVTLGSPWGEIHYTVQWDAAAHRGFVVGYHSLTRNGGRNLTRVRGDIRPVGALEPAGGYRLEYLKDDGAIYYAVSAQVTKVEPVSSEELASASDLPRVGPNSRDLARGQMTITQACDMRHRGEKPQVYLWTSDVRDKYVKEPRSLLFDGASNVLSPALSTFSFWSRRTLAWCGVAAMFIVCVVAIVRRRNLTSIP